MGKIDCHRCGPVQLVRERNPRALVRDMKWREDLGAYVETLAVREADPDDIVLECGHCEEMLDGEATDAYLALDNVHESY
jgi:hypothetical protein